MLKESELQSLRNMGNEAEAAADEIVELRAQLAAVKAWQAEGETLLEKRNISASFWLGQWWADRTWRVRA